MWISKEVQGKEEANRNLNPSGMDDREPLDPSLLFQVSTRNNNRLLLLVTRTIGGHYPSTHMGNVLSLTGQNRRALFIFSSMMPGRSEIEMWLCLTGTILFFILFYF